MTAIVDIVTGATQGIGKSTAELIAEKRSGQYSSNKRYLLVLVGRNEARGRRAVREILDATKLDPEMIRFEPCRDIGNWGEVRKLKLRMEEKMQQLFSSSDDYHVGILVNNAAECPPRQILLSMPQIQANGETRNVEVDRQFATNVLGYHFVLRAFESHFGVLSKTHVVNIGSNWAGDMDLEDLHFRRRCYDNGLAYRQSKQCNRMMSKAWGEKLSDVAFVNSCHPGVLSTSLSADLGFDFGTASPTKQMIEQNTPIPFLCGLLSGTPLTTTSGWYGGRGVKPRRCPYGDLTNEQERLFQICDSFGTK